MKRFARNVWTGVISVTVSLTGCDKEPNPAGGESAQMPIVKVAVYADGRLEVDGAPLTIQHLRETLKSLGERKGAVWYYREAGKQDPPPIAMDVMHAVVEAKLPIRMSSKPDYSDAIGPDRKPVKK